MTWMHWLLLIRQVVELFILRLTPLISSLIKLKNAMDSGVAFVGYEEGPLLFRPTYRYDVGTDVYDTSEKMRIPAWTGMYSRTAKCFMTFTSLFFRPYSLSRESVGFERLLACRVEGFRSPPSLCGVSHPRILHSLYDNVPMQIFRAEVRIVDQVKKAALSKMLLQGVSSTLPDEKLDEKLVALTFHDPSANRT